jgi:hypothetical protein
MKQELKYLFNEMQLMKLKQILISYTFANSYFIFPTLTCTSLSGLATYLRKVRACDYLVCNYRKILQILPHRSQT